jgi:hypothetical protein
MAKKHLVWEPPVADECQMFFCPHCDNLHVALKRDGEFLAGWSITPDLLKEMVKLAEKRQETLQ